MTLPATLDDALALIGSLVHDPNLILGLGTVAAVLVASGFIAWVLVSVRR